MREQRYVGGIAFVGSVKQGYLKIPGDQQCQSYLSQIVPFGSVVGSGQEREEVCGVVKQEPGIQPELLSDPWKKFFLYLCDGIRTDSIHMIPEALGRECRLWKPPHSIKDALFEPVTDSQFDTRIQGAVE